MTTALREAQSTPAGSGHEPGAAQEALVALGQGAIAGTVGTALMSAAMLAAHKSGLMGRLPPERITHKALFGSRARHRASRQKDAVATLLHFGFGAASGALFGMLQRRLQLAVSPVAQGLVFGSAVWFVSYMGWAPALGLMPPPQRDRPDRPVVMVLAHWIYGATLGAVLQLFEHRR